jgi:hypothetical protein
VSCQPGVPEGAGVGATLGVADGGGAGGAAGGGPAHEQRATSSPMATDPAQSLAARIRP